ncbi:MULTISPECIES: hypothetical protein [Paenibacillus]|uniref:DUF3052 domain-containing protein n=1 Tax=Paenibacillus validus TaxID=44253 RepID=A0A7X2ZGS8_9BACL|nr:MULTISPECIES: hypothetical protein [Paenibacillus]MUG73906.1 hypothetical protein [Paenibacillus validus]
MGLVKKLLIKPGHRIAVVNAPDGFALPAEELPDDAEVMDELAGEADLLLMFARNQAELQRLAPDVLPKLKDAAIFWVAYPKKSSKLKSDITRDSGWEILQQAGYIGVSLISIDDTWSAFRLRQEKYVKSSG